MKFWVLILAIFRHHGYDASTKVIEEHRLLHWYYLPHLRLCNDWVLDPQIENDIAAVDAGRKGCC